MEAGNDAEPLLDRLTFKKIKANKQTQNYFIRAKSVSLEKHELHTEE